MSQTRSSAIEILCRRLHIEAGRVTGLAQRLAEASLLPRAVGKSIPTLCSLELSRLFLAAVCDRGLGNATATVTTFESLTTETGLTLGDVLSGIFRGDADPSGDCAFQLSPAAAMLQVGNTTLYFGAELQAGVARVIHIPASTMRAIALEFSGHSPEEANRLTYQTIKDELQKARSKHALLSGELRQIESALDPRSATSEQQRVDYRARGRELTDDLSALSAQISELEPQVASLAASRKAEAIKKIPAATLALNKLSAALDAVSEAQRTTEQHRATLREAGLGWKVLPALTLPGAKTLVERAMVEMENAR